MKRDRPGPSIFLPAWALVGAVMTLKASHAFLIHNPTTVVSSSSYTPGALALRVGEPSSSSPARGRSVQMKAAAKPVSGRSLFLPNGKDQICYDVWYGPKVPSVVYLPTLFYPKNNAKSTNLENWCKRNGHTFLCADYYGVARSSGEFAQGTLTRWTKDTIHLLEKLIVKGPSVLVGSGVGGWISLLVAMQRPDLVCGLVTMAADPDFTEELLWKNLKEEEKEAIMKNGVHEITWGKTRYSISRSLIEDGRNNLVLRGNHGSIPITCPMRILHGMHDEEVPYTTAVKLANVVQTNDVKVIFSKSGDHFLDTEEDFYTMREALLDVVDHYFEYDLTTTASG